MIRKVALVLFKVFLSVGLCIFLFRKFDLDQMQIDWANLHWPILGLIAGARLMIEMLYAFRWQEVITRFTSQHLPYALCLRLTYIGAFFNQTLPGSVGGDAFRIYYMKEMGHTLGTSSWTILLDRIFGAVGLSIVTLIGAVTMLTMDLPGINVWIMYGAIIFSLGLILGAAIFLGASRWWSGHPKLDFFTQGAKVAKQILKSPRSSLVVFATTLMGQFCYCLFFYYVTRFLGTPIDLSTCCIAVPIALKASSLPISFGGWGVREGMLVLLLTPFQVPAADVIVASMVMGLLKIVVTAPGLVLWLLHDRHKVPSFG